MMKKIIVGFTLLAFISCNNNQDVATGATPEKDAAVTSVSSKGSNCEDLILFHKGAVITGRSYDAAGNETGEQVTTITGVRQSGNEMIADAEMAMKQTKAAEKDLPAMKMSYKCDGQYLYTDVASLLNSFSVLKDAKVEGNALQFPLQVESGQSLPAATVSLTMQMGGRNMKTTSTYNDRKVESEEKITTPAGSWTAYKISSVIDTDVDMGGGAEEQKIADMMKKSKPKIKMIMWYAPGVGVVKTESYSGGKLSSYSEVISIKD